MQQVTLAFENDESTPHGPPIEAGRERQSYNYKLCMKGKGGGVFLMVFEIINSY